MLTKGLQDAILAAVNSALGNMNLQQIVTSVQTEYTEVKQQLNRIEANQQAIWAKLHEHNGSNHIGPTIANTGSDRDAA